MPHLFSVEFLSVIEPVVEREKLKPVPIVQFK